MTKFWNSARQGFYFEKKELAASPLREELVLSAETLIP